MIELEPEVVAANRAVPRARGGDPLADPRVHVRLGDARGALTLAPSDATTRSSRSRAIPGPRAPPISIRASSSRWSRFAARARRRVRAVDRADVRRPRRLRALLAAQTEVFGHVQVYRPEGGAIVIVASDAPFDVAATAARGDSALAARDGLRRHPARRGRDRRARAGRGRHPRVHPGLPAPTPTTATCSRPRIDPRRRGAPTG